MLSLRSKDLEGCSLTVNLAVPRIYKDRSGPNWVFEIRDADDIAPRELVGTGELWSF